MIEPEPETMDEKDKATEQIPRSDSQKFIARVERRDKLVKVFSVILLLALVAFNVYVITQNQRAANERAATASIERRETKEYIRCLALLEFDVPASQLKTRDGRARALDNCAKTK